MEILKSKLIQEIGKNPKEVETFLNHFDFVQYKKGEHLKDSSTEEYLFFISERIVRFYYINELNQNNEINLGFISEENFIVDTDSFYGNRESKLKIQALGNVSTYRIEKETYSNLTKKFPKIEKFAINRLLEFNRLLLEKDFLLQRNFSEYSYENLISTEIFQQRIPIKFLAGYLGIHPNSLSRIRKKIKVNSK